jgi:DHA3 family macrolide efflux protein-like MFS transporter
VKRTFAPFILTQFASITSVISGSMVFIAIPWIALEIVGSAATAGLVVAITGIPGLVFAPLVGSVIDRFGRKRTAVWVESLTAFTALLIPLVDWAIGLTIPLLIAIGIVRGVVAPGGGTARKSLVPDVAEPAKMTLDRANSIHEAIFAAGFAIGPALATFLIARIGSTNTFYVVAVMGFLSALFAMLIFVTEKHEANDESEKEPFFIYALQGFKILFSNPAVFVIMAAIVILAVIYLPTEMVVLPAHFTALGDPEGLGLVISAGAAASVIGALGFEKLHKRFSYAAILRMAILGIGISMFPLSFLPSLPWMVVLYFFLGLAWGPLLPLLNTVIQKKIPANKRGRVFALEMTIWHAGPLISMYAVGSAVDALGVGPVYLFLAAGVFAAALLVSFNRYIKQLNT